MNRAPFSKMRLRWTARMRSLERRTGRNRMLYLIQALLRILLMATIVCFIYGQSDGAAAHLDLIRNFITEYQYSAPHGSWLISAMFTLAIALGLLACGFLLRRKSSFPGIAGCIFLAAAAMALFFVAYVPVRRMTLQQPFHQWLVPHWWFSTRMSHTPYEEGLADAYSDVHSHAIRLTLINGCIGMMLLALEMAKCKSDHKFAWITGGVSGLTMLLFILGEQAQGQHGLWQRAGFLVLYVWLWFAQQSIGVPALSHPWPLPK